MLLKRLNSGKMFDNLATSFNKRQMKFRPEWTPTVPPDLPQSLQDSMERDNRSSLLLRQLVAELNEHQQRDRPILSRNYDQMPTRPFSVPVSPDAREWDYGSPVNLKEAVHLSPFMNNNPKFRTFNKLL